MTRGSAIVAVALLGAALIGCGSISEVLTALSAVAEEDSGDQTGGGDIENVGTNGDGAPAVDDVVNTNGEPSPADGDSDSQSDDQEPPPSIAGDAVRGESWYKFNCQQCHGVDAVGQDGKGPNIQNVTADQVQAALDGQNDHPEFTGPSEQDVLDMAAFLNSF
jgi:cytochrome c1